MTASCMTCIYSQLTKEQYPCSECYYDNNGNPSKHEPVVEAPDINVGNIGTISRQVAIDMLDEQIELCNASLHKGVPEKDAYAIKVERASLMAYREKLECLPFVQPERKTGRWTLRRVTYLWEGVECEKFETRCSSCGCLPISGIKSTYCPNCGADMRGEG